MKKAMLKAVVVSVVCVRALLIAHDAPASAESFSGRWDGVYTCDQHALNPKLSPFTWKVRFDVQNDAISGQYNYHTREELPATATFAGRIDRTGNVTIDVIARLETGGKDFYQTLTGRAASASSIELAGLMLIAKGMKVRDCHLTLSLIAPAPSSGAKFAPAPLSVPVPAVQVPATPQDLDQERRRLAAQQAAIDQELRRDAIRSPSHPPASPTIEQFFPYIAIFGTALIGIILLTEFVSKRNPPSPGPSVSAPPEPTEAAPGKDPEADKNRHQPPPISKSWYYSDSGKRAGPISQDAFLLRIKNKELPRNISVWSTGMSEWTPLLHSELATLISGGSPPPLSATAVGNGYAWALALAPVWATALHFVLAYAYLEFKGQAGSIFSAVFAQQIVEETWFFGWAVNVIVAFLDNRALNSAGWSSQELNSWLVIIVPIYLYKRDQMLGGGMTRFWIWIGSFVFSLLPIW